MSDELRHCVYCRDRGRECEVEVSKSFREDLEGYQVSCATCGTCGPIASTAKRAVSVWDDNTESVVQAAENQRSLEQLISLTQEWKHRMTVSTAFVSGVASLLKEFTKQLKEEGS